MIWQGVDAARLAVRASLRDARLPTTLTGYQGSLIRSEATKYQINSQSSGGYERLP